MLAAVKVSPTPPALIDSCTICEGYEEWGLEKGKKEMNALEIHEESILNERNGR